MKKVLFILMIGVVCIGCKRTTFDYAGTEEPSNKPAYSVKFPSEIIDPKENADVVQVDPNHAVPQ